MRHIIIFDSQDGAHRFSMAIADGFICSAAENEPELKRLVLSKTPDAVVINAEYASDGLCDVVKNTRRILPSYDVPIIIATAENDCERQSEMCRFGADEIIHMPLCSELLTKSICSLLTDSSADISDIPEVFGVDELMDMVTEKNTERGAYIVKKNHFASICHFVERGLKRSRKNVQVLLMTLRGNSDSPKTIENGTMNLLSEAVKMCLRRGDISSVCSKNQIVILLMDADDDGGHLVANRIVSNFYSECEDSDLELQYDIRELCRAG